jgi:hypothetical protein
MRNKTLTAYYLNYERWPVPNQTRLYVRMTQSIPVLFTVTAGFAVTVRQAPVLADPPVAYYRLGEAPQPTIAVDSSASAHNTAIQGTTTWKVLKGNAPFTIESWVQLIDEYQINSRILGEAKTDTGECYGLDISLAEAKPISDDLFEPRGVLGEAVIYNYALSWAPVQSRHRAETVFETSALTSLFGLALILFGLVPRGWRSPLKFRGSDVGLSRAATLQVGVVQLRRRSEAELNSFSARYATIEVHAPAPLTSCRLDWRAARHYTRS